MWLEKSKGEILGKKSVIKGKKHYGGTGQCLVEKGRYIDKGGRRRNVIE
jgi:hypothetical protein